MRVPGKTRSRTATSELAARALARVFGSPTDREPPSQPVAGTARTDSLTVGSVLAAKYRLDRELGRGGMGAVWAAHNLALDIDVAIKVLRSDLPAPELQDRLMREARAVAQLGHPNIVRIFDVGNMDNGTPFLVMELLQGISFDDLIAREQRMAPESAVRMLLPVAHALARAHDAGFVHRDLKPENIFLAEQPGMPPRPILLDFGIALSWRDLSNRLTHDGVTVGTPAFMSPEQAKGDEVTYKGDIWSFSVLLYEAVTGRLPFSNTNFPRLQREIIENPAPHFAEYGLSEDDLWTLVAKGLCKEPMERWRNMRELGEALARWLLARGIEEDISNGSLRATWLGPPDESAGLGSAHTSKTALPLSSPGGSPERLVPGTVRVGRFSRHLLLALTVAGLVLAVVGGMLWFRATRGLHESARGARPTVSPEEPRRAAEAAPAAAHVPSHPESEGTSTATTSATSQDRIAGGTSPGRTKEGQRRSAGANLERRAKAGVGASPAPAHESAPSAIPAVPSDPIDIKTDF